MTPIATRSLDIYQNRLPASCDVVVIGAGMGGLTAAALLSKAGMAVCVLDMASRPGGYLSGFELNGFRFETAIHWLNQCGPQGFVRKIFDVISPGSPGTAINSRIRRFKSDVCDYLLTNDPNEMRDAIISRFEGEKGPVRRFFKASRTAAKSFSGLTHVCRSQETMSLLEKARFFAAANWGALPLMQYSLFSAEKGISTLFNSTCIKNIFSAEERLLSCLLPFGWAYENDYQLPPSGGSQAFPEWLCRILNIFNASVSLNARVERISVENGSATGVRGVQNGKPCDIRANYVVAACDVESLYARMLPDGFVDKRMLRKQRDADVFNSCITLSLGLDCPPSELGLNEEQVLLRRVGISREEHGCDFPDKTELSVIATSFRDPSLAPKGKGTVTVYAPASIGYGNFWESERDSKGGFVRGKAYQCFKKRYADIILGRVEEKLIPKLRSHIEVMDIATPLTYLRYTGNKNGAIMGFRLSLKNIRNRIARYSTPVKNLFVGGQWAELGGGVPVAVRAGMNSALMILRKESPETYTVLRDAVDGRISPETMSSTLLKTNSIL